MVVVLDFLVVPEHLEIEKRTIHHLLHQHKDILVEMEEVAVTEVLEAAVEQEERVLITLETQSKWSAGHFTSMFQWDRRLPADYAAFPLRCPMQLALDLPMCQINFAQISHP